MITLKAEWEGKDAVWLVRRLEKLGLANITAEYSESTAENRNTACSKRRICEVKKMGELTLCPTKKGNGFKAVVDGVWYYTSKKEMHGVVDGTTNAAKFRTIDEWNQAEVI